MELRPEPTGEKKAVNDRVIPSPSPQPSPQGIGRTTRLVWKGQVRKAFGRASVGRAPLAPSFDAWDRSRHSPNLDEAFARSPSPRGRGRGEGEGFVRFSIASPILQVTLPIPPKTAKNQQKRRAVSIANGLRFLLIRREFLISLNVVQSCSPRCPRLKR